MQAKFNYNIKVNKKVKSETNKYKNKKSKKGY